MKKIIVLTKYQTEVHKMSTFDEAWKEMQKRYNGFWDVEDWEEEYNKKEIQKQFEEKGYVEFCDGDAICTIDYYINNIIK